MRIAAISFTRKGAGLCSRLLHLLSVGHECAGYAKEKYAEYDNLLPLREDLSTWVERHFDDDALVFVGAAGIAVRGVAPFLRGKDRDPAVLVMDEQSRFIVPILSGHIGGANRLAEEIASLTGATPVITTATDVNGVFAPDEWAGRNGYAVDNLDMIKIISSALLEGEPVGFHSDFAVKGALPQGLTAVDRLKNTSESMEVGVYISVRTDRSFFHKTLRILPKCLYVGMGMRKEVSIGTLDALLLDTLAENHLSIKSVVGISTIELKKNEPGLLALCQKYRLPLYWYPVEVLRGIAGKFASSAFVEGVTGVDNVCERAAVAAAAGALIVPKRSVSGAAQAATIAIAQEDWIVEFV